MELSSANRSEIQPDLSDKAFKHLASYTQVEKLQRNVEWLKHQIFNAISKEEKADVVETLIDKFQIDIKKLRGYGWAQYDYNKYLPDMLKGLQQLKDEN